MTFDILSWLGRFMCIPTIWIPDAHILIHQQAKNLTEAARLEQLAYYYTMLVKHIDLVHRRLVNQETIPMPRSI